MTAKRDLKRRVRQRQARTGEAYVTARRHVLATRPHATPGDEEAASDAGAPDGAGAPRQVETAPAEASPAAANVNSAAGAVAADTRAASAPVTVVPVTELVDVSEEARRLGLKCRVLMFPTLAERVEPARVLARLRDLLFGTAGDPQTLLLSQVALTGVVPRLPGQPVLDFERLRRFVQRARAGLGGTSEDGSQLVFYIAGRDGIVPILVPILCSLTRSPAWPNASLVLSAIDELISEAELIKGRLTGELPGQVAAQLVVQLAPRPPLEPTLFVLHEGRRYPVTQDEFLIGRESATVHLAIKDGLVSRHHAAVIRRNGAYYLKDLGSTHGITYKGMRIDNKRIDEGDTFQIGDHELRFTFEPDE